MVIDLFTQALIAGILISVMAAPLGCFVVWRRMAYFGDAIAHSALLGVILGLTLQISVSLAILPVAALVAVSLNWLQHETRFSSDTLLGIIAHLALASGIVVLAMQPDIQIDLMAYLFGDILAVSTDDLILMYSMAALLLFLLISCWRPFMLITLHEDVARVHGIRVERYRLLLMLMVALTVAASIKLVGLLLITSLLIIPAATARFLANGPAQMACFAAILSIIATAMGLSASWQWDTPSGPTIVLVAGGLFLTAYTVSRVKRARVTG